VSGKTHITSFRAALLAFATGLLLLPVPSSHAQQQPVKANPGAAAAAAGQIADFFSKVGDQIYEDCIFELSEEQIEVQQELIKAYIEQGASGVIARRLAVKQIHPPKLSEKCEQIRRLPKSARPGPPAPPPEKPERKKAPVKAAPKPPAVDKSAPVIALKDKEPLPMWDCAPGVDYVTIKHKGYARKLSGGEICKPFKDVVNPVPAALPTFKLGYTIRTGRLFVIAEGSPFNGQTIAWALSGRDVCRNNPDPDCFAARAVGPLPPGEYSFAADKDRRISWGPKTKRNVAAIYLRKLWNKDRFTRQQTAAILARGNIAIHMRLKGEMSEACLGLEPKGWNYVASLIKDQRATSLDVYIDEPYPQVAEAPPVVAGSSFSLTSLFKL
jgi:hypothetical protein